MLKEILEGLSKRSDMKWVGGSDAYKDQKKIEKLVLTYDFHYDRIDDGEQHAKAKKKNDAITGELKKLGVTAFSNGGMFHGDFKKANKKDIKTFDDK